MILPTHKEKLMEAGQDLPDVEDVTESPCKSNACDSIEAPSTGDKKKNSRKKKQSKSNSLYRLTTYRGSFSRCYNRRIYQSRHWSQRAEADRPSYYSPISLLSRRPLSCGPRNPLRRTVSPSLLSSYYSRLITKPFLDNHGVQLVRRNGLQKNWWNNKSKIFAWLPKLTVKYASTP